MRKTPLKTRVILASSSPRRKFLLRQAGIRAAVMSPDCDESPIRKETPAAMVERLAIAKGHAVASRLKTQVSHRVIVIAADTIVVDPSGRKILGKPRNSTEATRMLRLIAGRTHEVLTGFCVVEVAEGRMRNIAKVVRSRVSLRALTSRQISAYVATGEPLDKAGSYAAQGLGMNFIRSIEGSYTNVVGLPMVELLEVLEEEFGLSGAI